MSPEQAIFVIEKLREGAPVSAIQRMTGLSAQDLAFMPQVKRKPRPVPVSMREPGLPIIARAIAKRMAGAAWSDIEDDLAISTGFLQRAVDLAAPITPRRFAADILADVAKKYGLTVADLKGPSRERRIAWPRQEAMWRIRESCPHISYPHIGRLLGGRDHTTIMHGVREFQKRARLASNERKAA